MNHDGERCENCNKLYEVGDSVCGCGVCFSEVDVSGSAVKLAHHAPVSNLFDLAGQTTIISNSELQHAQSQLGNMTTAQKNLLSMIKEVEGYVKLLGCQNSVLDSAKAWLAVYVERKLQPPSDDLVISSSQHGINHGSGHEGVKKKPRTMIKCPEFFVGLCYLAMQRHECGNSVESMVELLENDGEQCLDVSKIRKLVKKFLEVVPEAASCSSDESYVLNAMIGVELEQKERMTVARCATEIMQGCKLNLYAKAGKGPSDTLAGACILVSSKILNFSVDPNTINVFKSKAQLLMIAKVIEENFETVFEGKHDSEVFKVWEKK